MKKHKLLRMSTVALLVAIAGTQSSIAAINETEEVQNTAASSYVVADGSAGKITLDTSASLMLIHDSFLLAPQAPLQHKKPAAGTAIRGATIAREMYVTSTGYNSEVAQTDDSPFIAADGTHVFDGMVAANFLKFGTKIMFPDNFPGKVFYVHDRMNKRFSDRVDIWFPERSQAVQWGKRNVRIVILES